MNAMKMMLWTAAGAALLSVCGCDLFVSQRRESPVYVEQRPIYVEPPRREVIVQEAPPPVVEVRVR